MIRRLSALVFLTILVALPAQAEEEPYLQVRLDLTGPMTDLRPLGDIDLEVMRIETDALILVVRPAQLQELIDLGYRVSVEIDDLQAFYSSRLQREAANFGIFHTYSETVAEMNAIHDEYPDLTTEPISIGQTWEGNDIWAMKVSDNPNIEEDEPEVLFDGLHHAREIMTVEVCLHFPRYLCENYESDSFVKFLVDNRQVWFVPIVNPDGLLYNEEIAPNGGGMWRKNRRDNDGTSCMGVDPNRNYPYEWGGQGASPDPCDDTYRGPDAGSEPEVQAMMNFMTQHEFVTQNSYHSCVGVILYPWAYTSDPTPDDDIFVAIAEEMGSENGYPHGQVQEMLGYPACGGTFDWSYGEQQAKPKIFAFSTEIGGSGFWPAESERDPLIQENLYSNLYLTQVAGATVRVAGVSVQGGDGNGRLDPGETAEIVITVENNGVLAPADNVQAVLMSDDPYIQLHDAASSFGFMNPGDSGDNAGDPYQLTVDPATPEGHNARLTVRLTADPGFELDEDVSQTVGEPPIVYATDFEMDEGGWTQDPSHTAQTGAFVRIDPNPTSYQPGDDTTPDPGIYAWITGQNTSDGDEDVDEGISATRSPVLDLSGVAQAVLKLNYFFGQRDIGDDPGGDFFRIDLSNDGGATYPASLVELGDNRYPPVWEALEADLGSLLPLTSEMRLRVQASDGPAQGDLVEAGLDDIMVLEGNANDPPDAPVLVSPPDGAEDLPSQPTLEVANSSDPESDPLTYGFRVYRDNLMTDLAASVDGVAEGVGTTSWTVSPALSEGTYWWRAYAADPLERGPFMAAARFTVGEASSVDDAAARGSAFLLARPSPNPLRSGTRIPFYAPRSGRLEATVVDVSGRIVTTLYDGVVDRGWGHLAWNGVDGEGHKAASGFYWIRVRLGDDQKATRLLVVD